MLVLTRRIGERLRIGADIELVVLDVRGRDVRLGVSAPSDVAIHREEIYLKIQDANRTAAASQPGLTDALARSETKLQTIYESKIGKLSAVPRVRLKEDEVICLNLDHRAGFMLAQIDGTLSFEDLFAVSGMSRLDTARILAQLLDQRVIVS